jgi:hypothetical protein
MQRAKGTREDAPSRRRGLDSGEELRPPKKAGKDELTVRENPPLTSRNHKEILKRNRYLTETHHAVKTFLPDGW